MAVDDQYVSTLQHQTLGYAQVTSRTILAHIVENYSIVTAEVLEQNRNGIAAEWNPDDRMESLYTRITDAQRFATDAGAAHAIADSTALYLALTAIDKTGMFLEACSEWRKRLPATQTLANFRSDFTHAAKERNRRISAKAAGYEALLTTKTDDKENKAPTKPATVPVPDVIVDSIKMYYCWTHGLGFSSSHTSVTCNKQADGHCEDATIKNRKGGSNRIQGTSNRRS